VVASQGDRLASVRGGGDQLVVGVVLEQQGQEGAQRPVVVDDEDAGPAGRAFGEDGRRGDAVPGVAEPPAELRDVHRTPQEVALGLLAAELVELGELLTGLDPLGDRGEAEGVGEIDDAGDDGAITAVAPVVDGLDEPRHERAVDLERVDGELLQVGQRGVARPEVVHRDRDTQALEGVQRTGARLGVVQQHALGDLDAQVPRVQTRAGEGRGHHPVRAGHEQLAGRSVDGDPQVAQAGVLAVPGGDLLARLAEDERAEGDDEPGLLGDGDELRGLELLAVELAAGQRLHPDDAA
jgi:hypothetical protein